MQQVVNQVVRGYTIGHNHYQIKKETPSLLKVMKSMGYIEEHITLPSTDVFRAGSYYSGSFKPIQSQIYHIFITFKIILATDEMN